MNAARRRRRLAERVHVRHHIVAEAPFELARGLEVDVVEMRAHLRQPFVGDGGDAELSLRLGEREPQPAPERVAPLRRPERDHRARGVAFGERRRVTLVIGHRTMKSVE